MKARKHDPSDSIYSFPGPVAASDQAFFADLETQGYSPVALENGVPGWTYWYVHKKSRVLAVAFVAGWRAGRWAVRS